MNIRPKTMRRVGILLAVVVVLSGIVFAAMWLGDQAKARDMEERRAAGLRLFHAGEYEKSMLALSDFITYTNQHQIKDAEALFAYSKSRSRVEESNGRHLLEGMEGMRQVLRIQPDHDEARRLLLELYSHPRVLYNAEAVGLADEILRDHPDDPDVLRHKGLALQRMRKYDEALEVGRRLNELNPTDLKGLLLTLQTMAGMRRPPEEVIAWADDLRQKHPDDPRFELLLAYAHGYAQDETQARTWLRTAASRTPPDAEFVKQVADLFDRLRLYNEALAVLERSSALSNDVEILRVLVQRLWQNGSHDAVLKKLEGLQATDAKADSTLLGYKAMSLFQTGKKEEAMQLVGALEKRAADEKAVAWSVALGAHFTEEKIEPRELVDRLRTATVRDPQNAVLRFLLGRALVQQGRTDEAMGHWRLAADLAPSWSLPYIMVARTLTKLGQAQAAVDDAREAWERAPNNPAPAKALAVARYARALEVGDPKEYENVLDLVSQIQKYLPGESETLPMYVDLLARVGKRDEAVTALRGALSDQQDRPAETWVSLIEISQRQKLGLEGQLLERAKAVHGTTPAIALAEASLLGRSGKIAEGLELLKKSAAANPQHARMEWDGAVATYLDVADPSAAVEAWKALGESNPQSLNVQNAILESQAAWSNSALIDQTITRLKELTGEQSHAWRTHRARWLLENGTGEKELAEAISLLNEVVSASENQIEPRRLLAKALMKANNYGGAIDQLKIAAERSSSPAVLLELVRAMHKAAQFDQAKEYLNRLARLPNPRPEVRREVARLYAEQGELQQAIDLLDDAAGTDNAAAAQLADLYRRQSAGEQAQGLYEKVMADPNASASALQGAAEFFASRGQMQRAQEALARLETKDLPPGVRELVRATFAERHTSAEEAREQYLAATQAAPDDVRTWVHLADFYVRTKQFQEAISAADQGLQRHPGNGDLEATKVKASVLASGNAPTDLKPLIEALAKDADNAASVEALRVIQEVRQGGGGNDQMLARLQPVAERHPQFFPLQALLVQGLMQQRQFDSATAVAERTMAKMPASAAAAELAVKAHLAAQNWDELQFAARQWRKLDPQNAANADLMIAEAFLQAQRPGDTLRQLEPHTQAALKAPDAGINPALLLTYARALNRTGRSAKASEMLLPLAQKSPRWRELWLVLANSHSNAELATRWIDQVAPAVGNLPAEQLGLAAAWLQVGTDFGDASALAKARDVAKPGATGAEARPELAMVWAAAAERLGDMPDAEAAARRALELDPQSAGAMNNLAYFLLLQDKELDQARELASKAVQADPRHATYHDTLGRIQARAGEHEQAAASFQRAVELDPNLVEARVGLADVLARVGRHRDAQLQMDQIDSILLSAPPLPASVQTQLQRVKEQLSQAM